MFSAPLDGFRRFIRREPLGTVLVVAPWNYPYFSACQLGHSRFDGGNAVLLKHAAQTLLVGERFQSAFDKADLPRGLFCNLVLDHDQTARIIKSGQVQQINLTGSVAAGREIEKSAAGLFLGVGLELGGKDPAYVRADADLPFAIENIADGAFFNSGQSCCAIERVYVQRPHFDRVAAGLAEAATKLVLGSPLDPKTTLGPMVRGSSADLVREQVREAVRGGARRLVDPHAFPADRPGSPYLAPEVLIDVNHNMALMRDETFGPVVGVMPVDSDEEAIALMNDSPYGTERVDLDWRPGRGRSDGSTNRDRDRLRQPLRLSRPGPRLDGRQRHGPRHHTLRAGLQHAYPGQVLPLKRVESP